jgi:hypothetical protein
MQFFIFTLLLAREQKKNKYKKKIGRYWKGIYKFMYYQFHSLYRRTDRQTDGRTDRQTDGQTDGQVDMVKPVYPLQLRCGGIIILNDLEQLLEHAQVRKHSIGFKWRNRGCIVCYLIWRKILCLPYAVW